MKRNSAQSLVVITKDCLLPKYNVFTWCTSKIVKTKLKKKKLTEVEGEIDTGGVLNAFEHGAGLPPRDVPPVVHVSVSHVGWWMITLMTITTRLFIQLGLCLFAVQCRNTIFTACIRSFHFQSECSVYKLRYTSLKAKHLWKLM